MKNTVDFNSENFQAESKIISWLRFPLAVLVVFVHVPHEAGNLVTWVCSDGIASIAVPLFFVLSGYLYFINIKSDSSPKDWYGRKSKSRIHTLLIPYLFWALLPTLIFCIRKIVGMIIHFHGPDMLIDGLSELNLYHILWESGRGGPEILPLWFIRDLIVLSICTPVMWYFIKYAKYSSLIFILTACLMKIWIPIPGFSATSTLFYSIGAWCAIHRISLFSVSKWLFVPSAILTPIALTLNYFTYCPQVLFNAIAIPLFVHGAWLLFNTKSEVPTILATSTMFIYVTHDFIVESPKVWKIVNQILPHNGIGEIIGYFMVPIIVIIIMTLLNGLLRRFLPKTMQFLCGR